MLMEEIKDRSYLFGRLLAVIDQTEEAVYSHRNFDKQRITNAQKLWTSYTNHPGKTMQTLIIKIKDYESNLKNTNPGFFFKLDSEKYKIINILNDNYLESMEMDKVLNYYFIFGFYAEKRYLFTE